MQKGKLLKRYGLVALVILLVVLPFVADPYKLSITVVVLINVIMVTSFRFIALTGRWSITHIAMMGWGGYTSAIIGRYLGWSFWLTLPLGGLVSATVALILSYPLVRMSGFVFFLGSFAAGEAMRLAWTRIKVPFGGYAGIGNIPRPESFLGIDFGRQIAYYFLVLVICALCLWIIRQLECSRIGVTLKAIGSNEELSQSIGIHLIRYKTLAFVIGSFFAGIAGVLYAHYFRHIEPLYFGGPSVLYLLVWVIFGGMRTFVGPTIGLVTFTAIQELLRPSLQWLPALYGSILIFTLLFLPGGVESLPQQVPRWVCKVREVALRAENKIRR